MVGPPVATKPAPATRGRSPAFGKSDLALVGFAVLATACVLYVMQDAIIDDAFINLGYIKTMSHHFEWGMLPGIPSNTATSPLNVIVTSLVAVVVRSPMAAMWIVTLAMSGVLAMGLLSLGRQWQVGRRFAWIATAFLVLNPLLASSTGLETTATVTLVVFLLARASAGDWRTYGWLCGFGTLLRTDLVFVMAIIWLLHPLLWRPDARASAWVKIASTAWRAAIVALPWFAFSWLYFGSALPDTFAMKTTQTWWRGSFATGLVDKYLPVYPLAVWATLIGVIAGLVSMIALLAFRRTRYRAVVPKVAAAGLAGIAYFGLYCWLSVPPYFWYYGLPVGVALIVAAWAITAGSDVLFARRGGTWVRVTAGLAALVVFAPTAATWVRDLSRHTPLQEAPIHGNWALTPQYREIGEELAERIPKGAVVRSAGEFAIMLYYCDCTLIDRFDDRALIEDTLLEAKNERSLLMRLNYLLYDPDDYPHPEADFHLRYVEGWSDEPGAWNIFSPTRGRGHLVLLDGPRPTERRGGSRQ